MPPPPEDEFAALSRALATLRDRDTGAILTDEFLEVCRGVLPVIGHFGAALAAIVRSDVGGNIERLERARRRGKEATSGETAGGGGDSSAPSTSSASASAAAASVNSSDPSFRLLFSIPLDEIERGADLGAKSDAKGLLWLKRANDFILLMLENLLKGTKERGGGGGEGKKKKDASSSSSSSAASPPLSVSAAARAAYNDTLRKYHGMLTAAAFSAALSLAPSRATFFSAVARSGGGGSSSGGSSGANGGGGANDGDGGDDDEAKVLPSLSAFLKGFGPVLREIDEWFTAKGLNDPAKV